ncbi:unnamed protein product [Cyprideis torosa]|uniref:Uncharacterized protein n=1 Tax=Cyprideis torosa TaxID=163714 RepID=A0A7R8ZVL3_9CRUS|nr:unnamed protein product [Cyprideis torosa]CAG0903526.1 unnamed protein product [Cyprideis torosa]
MALDPLAAGLALCLFASPVVIVLGSQNTYKGRQGILLTTESLIQTPSTSGLCAIRCTRAGDTCQAFNFNPSTGICSLYSGRYSHGATFVNNDETWYYEKDWKILYQTRVYDTTQKNITQWWRLSQRGLGLQNEDTISFECQQLQPIPKHYVKLNYEPNRRFAKLESGNGLTLVEYLELGGYQTYKAPTAFSDLVSAGTPYTVNITCTEEGFAWKFSVQEEVWTQNIEHHTGHGCEDFKDLVYVNYLVNGVHPIQCQWIQLLRPDW